MRYKKAKDGEWISPRRKNYYVQCCDCGLAHKIDFKLTPYGNGKRISFRAFRVPRKKKRAICKET